MGSEVGNNRTDRTYRTYLPLEPNASRLQARIFHHSYRTFLIAHPAASCGALTLRVLFILRRRSMMRQFPGDREVMIPRWRGGDGR